MLRAIIFASGTEEISITRTEGHFGNSIIIFEAGLTKTGNMRTFLQQLKDAGILKQFLNRTGQRLDENCVFHFRLDKQKAFAGELALAETKDVIDISVKVAAYPARRELALVAVGEWFGDF